MYVRSIFFFFSHLYFLLCYDPPFLFSFFLSLFSGLEFKRILYRSLYRAECWPAVTRTTVFVAGTIDSLLDHLEPLPPQKSEKLISFCYSIYFILRDFLIRDLRQWQSVLFFVFYFVFSFFFSNCHLIQNVEKIEQNIARQELR